MVNITFSLVFPMISGLLSGQIHWLDVLVKSLSYQSHYYAVIIDAGSSGTRISAYKFRVSFTSFGPSNPEIVEEYYKPIDPGLSSYADEPAKGAETIVRLIKDAEFLTPVEKRSKTPLIVRATAGLRLLPKEKAQRLIDHVSKAIAKFGYNVNNNSVEIMSGADEGIYDWYTINLLYNLMDGDTMATLDLGGGSTQITYQVKDLKGLKYYPAADLYKAPVGNNITLYTHSYLKLGLYAARNGILQLELGNTTNKIELRSVCVNSLVRNVSWVYGNTKYIVSGHDRNGLDSEDVYNRCYKLVQRYIMVTVGWGMPQVPLKGKICAISYFFEVAVDAGLIDAINGGTVSVSAYREAAVRACSASNDEQPWACLNRVYMVSLLQDVFKVEDTSPISVFQRVKGYAVSWTLGLAYTTIMNNLITEFSKTRDRKVSDFYALRKWIRLMTKLEKPERNTKLVVK